MIPIGLSQRDELKYFPILPDTSDVEYRPRETFEIEITNPDNNNSEVVGYCCMEKYSPKSVNCHIFVNENRRNAKVMTVISTHYVSVVGEYMRAIGCTDLYTSCSGEDTNVKRLMESCGFKVEAHWVGTLKF